MKIVCLGWGSLTWDRRDLKTVSDDWHKDGPHAAVEFLRKSKDGRITLVIDKEPNGSDPVRLFWAEMGCVSLDEAKESLRAREGNTLLKHIGAWKKGEKPPAAIPALDTWADERQIDAVIWTDIPPQFNGDGKRPEVNEVIKYLSSLNDEKKSLAEKYVRRAPQQIKTKYRKEIEKKLGWYYGEEDPL